MIVQIGAVAERVFRRTCPDPFVIAILLALLTAVLALLFGDWPGLPPAQPRPVALLDTWRAESGIWKFLSFSMQMCLVLVTGHALAAAPPVRRLIVRLAAVPRTPGQAVALVAAAATISGVINWGLSLITGALLAREVGRAAEQRGLRVHYPLLAAAGFLGLLVWHGGLSGSAPLLMSSRTSAEKVLPAAYLERLGPHGIPLSETLFSPLNLVVTGGLLLIVPLLAALLHPRRAEAIATIARYAAADETRRVTVAPPEPSATTPAIEAGGGVSPTTSGSVPDWLDRSWVVAVLIAIPFLAAVARTVWMEGLKLAGADAGPLIQALSGLNRFGLNEVNATMLALGLLLHASPRAYMAAAEDGARGCGGIIIQFPIYAGIVAVVETSGLTAKIASGFVAAGTAETIPLLTLLAAGVINFFIPSGGAQWGVQGPIAMRTAADAQIDDMGRMVMSVAYGDQLTNMLQPFWALPLICITGVPAREIVGYTAVLMLFAGVWMMLGLLLV